MKKNPEPGCCPFCEKPGVGLDCPEPACVHRVAKQREEVVPAADVSGWSPQVSIRIGVTFSRGRRKGSGIRPEPGEAF